jgi:hypothetical protein
VHPLFALNGHAAGWTRTAILVAAFLPFVVYATRDQIFHLRGRKVSVSENLLHFGLGITLATLFTQALKGNHAMMVGALVLFAVAGGVDEYVYHRGIPGEESDLHAKEHLALMIFLITVLAVDWWQGRLG